MSRPLKLALPCGGIDAVGHYFKARGVPVVVSYFYDIGAHLQQPLSSLHGPVAGHFSLGPDRGDLLTADIENWLPVDGIIAGPPCPPWSALGSRGGQNDVRSLVFNKVGDVLVSQGHKGASFFILEQVPGIDHNTGKEHEGESFLKEFLSDLQCRAPMWRIAPWRLNSADFNCPQSRPRLYIVGVSTYKCNFMPLPPASLQRQTSLVGLLHVGITKNMESRLSSEQRGRLQAWKRVVARRSPELPATICISLDRKTSGAFGESWVRMDGLCCALRTQNEFLWIMHVDSTGKLDVSRCLHPLERFALQGFPCHVSETLSKPQVLLVTGNAMSVPVVGAVVSQIMFALARTDEFGCQYVPRSIGNMLLVSSGLELHRKRRRSLQIAIATEDGERLDWEERLAQLRSRTASIG